MQDHDETLQIWDCHTHIYGPWDRFPLAPDAAYRPPAAPFSEQRSLHARLGITHGVLVQPAPYGTDHSAILDAVAASGGHYRGVGIVDEAVSDEELDGLHAGGIRGIRFNLMGHLPGARDPQALARQASRMGERGWHVLIHGELETLLPFLDAWRDITTNFVIDHMARLDFTRPFDAGALRRLQSHLDRPDRWIKLSGIDRAMQGRAGPWPQAVDQVRGILDFASDRAIWGTDWPHPNIKGPVPDEGELLAFIETVCGTDQLRRAVLSDNPRRLYS